MSIKFRKPIEPVIMLFASSFIIIASLFLNYFSASISYLGYNFPIYYLRGIDVPEVAFVLVLSSSFMFISGIIYYLNSRREILNYSRYLAFIATIIGFIGILISLLGINSSKSILLEKIGTSQYNIHYGGFDWGIALGFAGVVGGFLGFYMMKNSINAFFGNTKEAAFISNTPTYTSGDPKEIQLKKLWYCPKDNFRLTANVNRMSPSPEFIISRERITDGINNALATRKITRDVVPYATTLLDSLFASSNTDVISVVSTICPQCKTKYISPKLESHIE